MKTRTENDGNNGFLIGLITGGVIGAGLAIVFAPRLAAELRQRVTASAAGLGHAASQGYSRRSATRWRMRSAAVLGKSSSLRWPRRPCPGADELNHALIYGVIARDKK